MRVARWISICAAPLAALALQWPVTAFAGGPAEQNLRACVDGYSHCDLSLLDEQARQQVAEADNRRHFQDCLSGKRCNLAKLGTSERRRVEESVARLNLENCLRGDGRCRKDMLADDERNQVEQAARRRNLDYCYNGLAACEESWLSDAERSEAHSRYLERNFGNCVPGFERFTRCNPDDLSESQRAVLRQRLREANLYICTHALMGCDEELLTPGERATIGAIRPALRR
jgi:hypothetical protein